MKIYESVIIVNSSLNEDTLNHIISHCESVIKKQGGKLRETNRWSKRRLAYPIKKFQYGFYIIFEFEGPSLVVSELEREYRLNEHILRFMTLHKDKKTILAEQKKKEEKILKVKIEQEAAAEPNASDHPAEVSTSEEETKPEPQTEPESSVSESDTEKAKTQSAAEELQEEQNADADAANDASGQKQEDDKSQDSESEEKEE